MGKVIIYLDWAVVNFKYSLGHESLEFPRMIESFPSGNIQKINICNGFIVFVNSDDF